MDRIIITHIISCRPMNRWSVLLVAGLLLIASLAGCLVAEDEELPAIDDSGPLSTDPRLELEELEGGAPDEWNATLEAPPQWRLGQWWKIRLTEHFTETSKEITVVVAGAERDWFLTGMPEAQFDHHVMVMHMPGVGQIGKSDLRWDVHDEYFQPMKFPLRNGDSWETHWSALPVQADVASVSGTKATIEVTGDNQHFELVYDADVGTITYMEIPGYATMEVIDHGFDYKGVVTVPHMHDLIFFHGRIVGALGVGFQDMEPHPPMDTIPVEGDYDRVSFGIILFGLTPGVYMVEVTAPDGTQYQESLIATQPDMIMISIQSNEQPVGDWEAAYVAAGVGAAFIEGIAYHVFDIHLPSGCLLGDMGGHEHHGEEEHEGC